MSNAPKTASPSSADDQRQELADSERKASEDQPGSFKDSAMKDKVVEVEPIAPDDSAIKGLDPK